jgi:hypothetical protein
MDLSEGEWSVALSSIIYPVSFQADSKESLYVGFVYTDKPTKVINLPEDLSFSSIEQLEKTVNEAILGHAIDKPKPRPIRSLSENEEVPETDEVSDEEEEIRREKRDDDTIITLTEISDKDKKLLNAAINEVETRSFDAAFDWGGKIEDKIVEIEMLGAKAEALKFDIDTRIIISENFNKEEAKDIEHRIQQARVDAINIRNNAQQKRHDVTDLLNEYSVLSADFQIVSKASDVKKAREMANQAKAIVKRLELLNNGIDSDKEGIKILVDFLFETNTELTQMLKPIDIGMKNNIARIKETILTKIGTDKLSDLEVYFHYDENYGRFFLYNHRPMEIKAVQLSPRLAYLLGFEIDKLTMEVKHVRVRREGGYAKFTPDITAGIHQLYVYAPGLVDTTYVGNVQAPLLRIVNVDKPPNSIGESIYSNLHFIKVIEKRISSIKIEVHDSFGQFIKFNWGNIILTLAFKRNIF